MISDPRVDLTLLDLIGFKICYHFHSVKNDFTELLWEKSLFNNIWLLVRIKTIKSFDSKTDHHNAIIVAHLLSACRLNAARMHPEFCIKNGRFAISPEPGRAIAVLLAKISSTKWPVAGGLTPFNRLACCFRSQTFCIQTYSEKSITIYIRDIRLAIKLESLDLLARLVLEIRSEENRRLQRLKFKLWMGSHSCLFLTRWKFGHKQSCANITFR